MILQAVCLWVNAAVEEEEEEDTFWRQIRLISQFWAHTPVYIVAQVAARSLSLSRARALVSRERIDRGTKHTEGRRRETRPPCIALICQRFLVVHPSSFFYLAFKGYLPCNLRTSSLITVVHQLIRWVFFFSTIIILIREVKVITKSKRRQTHIHWPEVHGRGVHCVRSRP